MTRSHAYITKDAGKMVLCIRLYISTEVFDVFCRASFVVVSEMTVALLP
jgi:hypothetical protein